MGNVQFSKGGNKKEQGIYGMRRFFVDQIHEQGGLCIITGSEARHMSKVLRLGVGDQCVLVGGDGKRFLAIIESSRSKEVRVRLEDSLPVPASSPVKIMLNQSLVKSKSMDYIVQKTSELGVDTIIPYRSKRTVVRLQKHRVQNRIDHWTSIARNAAKQADRAKPAKIGSFCTFADLVKHRKDENSLKIILWEEETSADFKKLLHASHRKDTFIGVVGPEGGFDREEIAMAKKAGFLTVSLGQRILRAETAAIIMVGLVQYEWGDLGLGDRGK
jgi:16S rRNA (uracil1498-N3)-methyltransferase